MGNSLVLAPDLVPEYCTAVGISPLSPAGQLAKTIASRVDGVEGESLPMAPSSLAAGSIYLASRIAEPNVTQSTIANATETNEVALRNGYHEIALQLGIASETPSSQRGIELAPEREWPDWIHDYTDSMW